MLPHRAQNLHIYFAYLRSGRGERSRTGSSAPKWGRPKPGATYLPLDRREELVQAAERLLRGKEAVHERNRIEVGAMEGVAGSDAGL